MRRTGGGFIPWVLAPITWGSSPASHDVGSSDPTSRESFLKTLLLSSLLTSFLPITRATDMVMCLRGGKNTLKQAINPSMWMGQAR
jgi:hypothetical protein